MCVLPTQDIIGKLLKDGFEPVPSLAKVCSVSIGLLLIIPAAIAQTDRERIGALQDKCIVDLVLIAAKDNDWMDAQMAKERCVCVGIEEAKNESYDHCPRWDFVGQ